MEDHGGDPLLPLPRDGTAEGGDLPCRPRHARRARLSVKGGKAFEEAPEKPIVITMPADEAIKKALNRRKSVVIN